VRTRDMGDLVLKPKTVTKPFLPQKDKDQRNPQREWKGKPKLDDDTRQELMRKKFASLAKILGSQGIDAWEKVRSTTLKWNQAARRRMRIYIEERSNILALLCKRK
jgi:hypothetical protein